MSKTEQAIETEDNGQPMADEQLALATGGQNAAPPRCDALMPDKLESGPAMLSTLQFSTTTKLK